MQWVYPALAGTRAGKFTNVQYRLYIYQMQWVYPALAAIPLHDLYLKNYSPFDVIVLHFSICTGNTAMTSFASSGCAAIFCRSMPFT